MKHQLTFFTKRLATGVVAVTTVSTITAWQMVSPTLADSIPVIVCQHDGIDSLMPDDRDAGLRRAVAMLTTRIAEIPAEIQRMTPGGPPPEVIDAIHQIIPLVSASFNYPGEWALLDNGINELGVPDFDARVVMETGSQDEAEKLKNAIISIFKMGMPNVTLQPSDANPMLLTFPTPISTLLFGPVNDQGSFVIGFDFGGDGLNTDRIALTPPSELGSIHPTYQVYVNGQGVMGMVDFFSNMIPDPMVKEKLQSFHDKLGDVNINLNLASGYRKGESISVTKITNFKKFVDLIAEQFPSATNHIGTISEDLFKNVPADARMVSATNQNIQIILQGVIDNINLQMEANPNNEMTVEDMLQNVKMSFGFNPMDDLIAHLGSDWVSYTADSTGGGGLSSLVFLNKGADTTALEETFVTMENVVNGLAYDKAMGYVRCREWRGENWRVPGLKAGYTLTFPGIPVPIELSLGMTDDCLIVGFTPQAVQAAVLQCAGKMRGSILNNPRFKASAKGNLDNVSKLAFIDYQASIARGYPMAQLIGTAFENFVRSPSDPSRDPGMVVPSFADLTHNVHGFMQTTRLNDNDFVQITKSDASWFVNIAGLSGALGITPELIGAGAIGAAIGANAH